MSGHLTYQEVELRRTIRASYIRNVAETMFGQLHDRPSNWFGVWEFEQATQGKLPPRMVVELYKQHEYAVRQILETWKDEALGKVAACGHSRGRTARHRLALDEVHENIDWQNSSYNADGDDRLIKLAVTTIIAAMADIVHEAHRVKLGFTNLDFLGKTYEEVSEYWDSLPTNGTVRSALLPEWLWREDSQGPDRKEALGLTFAELPRIFYRHESQALIKAIVERMKS